mgnify:CR=1 FL=1
MFTGLVTDVGTIRKAENRNGLRRFEVTCNYAADSIEMGASIMHAGVCLTVVDFGPEGDGSWFAVEAVPETLSLTVLGEWEEGSRVNLEQSLKLGQELGGHFVFGHVDGVGEIINMISGSAKRYLTDTQFYFQLSLPTVIVGWQHEIGHPEGSTVAVLVFDYEDKSFAVQVSLTPGKGDSKK